MNSPGVRIGIHVNGEPSQVPDGQPLLELIVGLGLHPVSILIERNGEALLRGEWEQIRVAAGDQIEILRVVAGG